MGNTLNYLGHREQMQMPAREICFSSIELPDGWDLSHPVPESSDKVNKIQTKYLKVKCIISVISCAGLPSTLHLSMRNTLISHNRVGTHFHKITPQFQNACGGAIATRLRVSKQRFPRYLGHLPASTAHHHQSGSLHQSRALERKHEPGGHLCRRMGNRLRALLIASCNVNISDVTFVCV